MASFEAVHAKLREGAGKQQNAASALIWARLDIERCGGTVSEMATAVNQAYGASHDTIEAGRLMAIASLEGVEGYVNSAKGHTDKSAAMILGALEGSGRQLAADIRGLLAVQPENLIAVAGLATAIKINLSGLTVTTMPSGLETISADLRACDTATYDRVNDCQLIIDSVDTFIHRND